MTNQYASLFKKADPISQRKKALAKVYDFLIKLAEEKETKPADLNKDKSKTELLKLNIPPRQ
jgi:hypothetical protein